MKKVTLLVNAIALVLAPALVQAVELVKVDTLDNTILTENVSVQLASSLKEMNLLTVNVKESAETLLVTQADKQIQPVELEATAYIATAE